MQSMPVKIKYRKREYQIEGNVQLGKALKRLNINLLSILAIRDKNLITEDEMLRDGEEIELVEVISGG
jgi:sulfur carrier protein ThiS